MGARSGLSLLGGVAVESGRFGSRALMEKDAMKHLFRLFLGLLMGLVLLASQPARTDEKPARKISKRAWTLPEAQAALALDPHDAYLQFLVLQLARRENR